MLKIGRGRERSKIIEFLVKSASPHFAIASYITCNFEYFVVGMDGCDLMWLVCTELKCDKASTHLTLQLIMSVGKLCMY